MDSSPTQPILNIHTLIADETFLPSYATEEAAGADVRAYLEEPIILRPGHSVLVPTGMRVAIPAGYEIQVRPRSGLAFKHQITVLNSPGTIDADYRGEIGVILINHGNQEFIITPGMRIAQLILAPVVRANFVICRDELTATRRGAGGFGHTGLGKTH